MFGLFTKTSEPTKNSWKVLDSESQVDALIERSKEQPLALFKHSTRCSISSMVKSRLESSWKDESPELYILDLLRYRSVSNYIEDKLAVTHQSPQLILLKNGKVVYQASHGSIEMSEIIRLSNS
jgi:bacillithiol system protein YtxJ